MMFVDSAKRTSIFNWRSYLMLPMRDTVQTVALRKALTATLPPALSGQDSILINSSGLTPQGQNGISLLSNASICGSLQAAILAQSAIAAASSAGRQAPASGWITETELAGGLISAALSSDAELGIEDNSDAVLESVNDSSAIHGPGAASSGVSLLPKHADGGCGAAAALSGSISYNTAGIRTMKMKKGALVFAPRVDSSVRTEFGTVEVKAGSLVLLLSFADGLAVYDLDDMHRGAVSLRTPERQFNLYPGMNVVVTRDSVRTFEQVNPAQLFGYRNLSTHTAGAGLKAFSMEFYVPTAIRAVLPLKQLFKSRHPNARQLAEHLLKTTAATMQVKAKGAQYRQILRPIV